MAPLDLLVSITFAFLASIAGLGVILRLATEQLKKKEEEVGIVKWYCLHEVEKGMDTANELRPDSSHFQGDHFPIVDLAPLDSSLKTLGQLIRDYVFWASFLNRAEKKLLIGSACAVLTAILMPIYFSNDVLSVPLIEVTLFGIDTGVSVAGLCGLAGFLLVIPLVYGFLWTLWKAGSLQDEIINARKAQGALVTDETSGETEESG